VLKLCTISHMTLDATTLNRLVELELENLSDDRVRQHIRSILVEPTIVMRDWDYGSVGQQYPCWAVLEHIPSNTGIAYCQEGFGPSAPWGLVFLSGERMSIGMDSGWFATFLQSYFESQAATFLPIWRVFKTEAAGERQPITQEGEWDQIWEQVMAYRNADSTAKYDCGTSVSYARE